MVLGLRKELKIFLCSGVQKSGGFIYNRGKDGRYITVGGMFSKERFSARFGKVSFYGCGRNEED